MKYKRRIHEPAPRSVISSGRSVKDTYMLDIAPNGDEKLVKTGTVDLQEEIDSHVGLCDVKKIVERFTMSGEMDKLMANGSYVDFTGMPKNLAEVHALLGKSRECFDRLKPEIKNQFESFEDFLSNFGTVTGAKSFLERFSEKHEKPEIKEVDSNETFEQK